MFTASLIILTVMVTISLVTVAAFSWAASNRQFDHLEDASQVIFDEDEPIGKPTDPAIPEDQRPAIDFLAIENSPHEPRIPGKIPSATP